MAAFDAPRSPSAPLLTRPHAHKTHAGTDANYATYNVCLLAAAAWMDAARHTLLGEDGRGHGRRMSFALTRPPGHHSVRDQAGGFCIFNFAVCAAKYALEELGCRRVAILDWCVVVAVHCPPHLAPHSSLCLLH